MKINKLETHDRLLSFQKEQRNLIQEGCEECLKKNPYSLALQEKSKYIYIFAHPRTIGLDEKLDLIRRGLISTPK
jgi:hypothetical protein